MVEEGGGTDGLCVTRRKLQTPGNAEEHKRQETPTINPIGPTDKPHRLVLHGESNTSQASPRTPTPHWLFVFPLCGFSLSLFCNYFQHNARSNRRKQCSPNETRPYSNPTPPRKRQNTPTQACVMNPFWVKQNLADRTSSVNSFV